MSAGKGDKNNRVSDWRKYRNNFDTIFRQPLGKQLDAVILDDLNFDKKAIDKKPKECNL